MPAASQRDPQVTAGRFPPARRRGGDTGVEAEQRIVRAQLQSLACPAQPGRRPARPGERPAERVSRAHARRRAPDAPAQPHRGARVAVLCLEQDRLGVGRRAGRAEQPALGAGCRQVRCAACRLRPAASSRSASSVRLVVSGSSDVARRSRAIAEPRSGRAAHPRAPDRPAPAGCSRIGAQRAQVGVARRRGAAAPELEVAEERLDVGAVLGRAASGRHRQAHRLRLRPPGRRSARGGRRRASRRPGRAWSSRRRWIDRAAASYLPSSICASATTVSGRASSGATRRASTPRRSCSPKSWRSPASVPAPLRAPSSRASRRRAAANERSARE